MAPVKLEFAYDSDRQRIVVTSPDVPDLQVAGANPEIAVASALVELRHLTGLNLDIEHISQDVESRQEAVSRQEADKHLASVQAHLSRRRTLAQASRKVARNGDDWNASNLQPASEELSHNHGDRSIPDPPPAAG
jgi:hypothetical protein